MLTPYESKLDHLVDERVAGEDWCSDRFNALGKRRDQGCPVDGLGGRPLVLNAAEVPLVRGPSIAEPFIVDNGEDPREKEVTRLRCEDG